MELFEKFTGFFDSEKKKEADDARRLRGVQAKSFLESEFFMQHLLPYIEMERMDGYPSPGKRGWEEAYRLNYAKDEAYTKLLSTIRAWVKEGEMVHEEEIEKKIV